MIDPSRTVADLVLEQPSRARVFEELGVDYCCGGKQSLSTACDARGLAVAQKNSVELVGSKRTPVFLTGPSLPVTVPETVTVRTGRSCRSTPPCSWPDASLSNAASLEFDVDG